MSIQKINLNDTNKTTLFLNILKADYTNFYDWLFNTKRNYELVHIGCDDTEPIYAVTGFKNGTHFRWNLIFNNLPKFLYEYSTSSEFKIDNTDTFIIYCKVLSIFLSGNKYISSKNVFVKNETTVIEDNLLLGCWYKKCSIKSSKGIQQIQCIIDEYTKENSPLKYSQCWIYAVTMCALLKLRDIEARVVIGDNTKIDVNRNGIYDPFIKENKDMKWNFHVWNEIKNPIDGQWYSLDCTPNVSMTEDKHFVRGPVLVNNSQPISEDYKYFKFLTNNKFNDIKVYYYIERDNKYIKTVTKRYF